MLESNIKNSNLRIEMLQQQIFKQEATIKQLTECSGSRKLMNAGHRSYCSKLVDGFKLSEQGECRVLAHSNHLSLLVSLFYCVNPSSFWFSVILKLNLSFFYLRSLHNHLGILYFLDMVFVK